MSFREFLQYYESNSWLHIANPFLKFIFTIFIIFIVFIVWDLHKLIYLTLIITLTLASIRPPKVKVNAYMKITLFIIISTIISQSLFYYEYYVYGKGTIILYLLPPTIPIVREITFGKGVALVYEGFKYGFLVSLKIISMMLASLLLILTTRPGDLIKAFNKLGVPNKVAIAAITTIRFLPITIEEIYSAITALRLKGEKIGLRKIFFHIKTILKNVILNSAKRAYILGISLELRGFKGIVPNIEIGEKNEKVLSDILLIFIMLFIITLIFISTF